MFPLKQNVVSERIGWKHTNMNEYQKYSDAELMSMIDSDDRAPRELFERHSGYIVGCLKKYFKISQIKAEDVCMETFSKIFSSSGTFNEKRKFRTWAFSIAKNLLIDQYRRENGKKKKMIGSRVDVSDENIPIFDTTPTHEDLLSNKKLTEKIIKEIDTLPPLYRDIAKMRFIREFQYKNIAKELNLPLNTVKTRVRRAKNILSNKLK